MNKEIEHLNLVADALIDAGFEVNEVSPLFPDLLDVWGYVGNKKCFLEIYCTIVQHDEYIYSYWNVNYDNDNEHIELYSSDGELYDESDLVEAVKELIKPIRKVA